MYKGYIRSKDKEIADIKDDQQAARQLHVGSLGSLVNSREVAKSAGHKTRAYQLEQSIEYELHTYMLVQKEFDEHLLELRADKKLLEETLKQELGELSSRQIEEAEAKMLGHRNWPWLET